MWPVAISVAARVFHYPTPPVLTEPGAISSPVKPIPALMKTAAQSSRGFTLVEIMIVVVIIGLLAAMAIPAFQKVRSTSQDKAVLNNLRQLSSAADQYFLEQGVTSCNSTDLVGTNTTQYIKQIQTVAGESYTAVVSQGAGVTATGIAGSRTITFSN